jgi:hypothetical protein
MRGPSLSTICASHARLRPWRRWKVNSPTTTVSGGGGSGSSILPAGEGSPPLVKTIPAASRTRRASSICFRLSAASCPSSALRIPFTVIVLARCESCALVHPRSSRATLICSPVITSASAHRRRRAGRRAHRGQPLARATCLAIRMSTPRRGAACPRLPRRRNRACPRPPHSCAKGG